MSRFHIHRKSWKIRLINRALNPKAREKETIQIQEMRRHFLHMLFDKKWQETIIEGTDERVFKKWNYYIRNLVVIRKHETEI
jgi:hypothetical protein